MADKELTLEELLAQHEALAAKIAEIKSSKKAEVIESIKAQIKAYDIAVNELYEWQQEAPKRGRKPGGEASGGSTKEKLPPKYRSSVDPSLTWSGRGKHPAWIKVFVDNGGNLDDWLIKD
jgi:DNA-binding protein H-NS